MKPSTSVPLEPSEPPFARQLIAQLKTGEEDLSYEVTERLRAARSRAVQRRKTVFNPLHWRREATAQGHTTSAGGEMSGYWGRFAGWLPLVGLLFGLFFIQSVQNDQRANELAEIDAALLTDDLPPAAYADPGFAHFLKTRAVSNP